MTSDRPRRSAFAAFLGIVAVAVVAGVMVTVGVAPAIALTGVTSGNSIGLFEDLPSDLQVPKLDQRTEIYAKSGTKGQNTVRIAQFFDQNREVITWKDVTSTVKNATLAAEDVRFYEHGAIDPTGILRAIVTDATGGDVSGASTITQQLVKNVCVQEAEKLGTAKAVTAAYNKCTAGDVGRKIAEARYAIGLEQKYSKDQILLNYLNIAGFGGNVYGIQAAAQYYFGIDEQKLTIAQAASLIAIVNNPSYLELDEKSNLAANTSRRDYILGVELKYKMISQTQYDTAIKSVTKPKITPIASGCNQAGVAGFFCDYVTRVIQTDSHFGATPTERYDNLYSKGWKIYTTLNLDLEKKAQKVIDQYVPMTSSELQIGSSAVSVGVGTGQITTMVQNKKYNAAGSTLGAKYAAVNYNVDEALGGSGGIQPGSTYKLFTLLDWLNNGHSLYDSVDGSQRTIPASDFTVCKKQDSGAAWSVGNDEGSSENGLVSVINATAASINGAFASMGEKLDLCDIRSTAEKFDVHAADGGSLNDYPASIIGTNYVAPLTMATAYAAMGNNGTVCTPVAISQVVDTTGATLPVPTTKCTQAATKDVTLAADQALRAVFTYGTATGDSTSDGVYEVGKTGTTDGNANTWTIGTSNKIATAVWVGNVSGYVDLRTIYNFPTCGIYGNGQAAIERHCVWRGIQTLENEYYGGSTSTFGTPDSTLVYGAAHTVPNVAGDSEATAESTLVSNNFSWAIGSTVASDAVAQGAVASTTPAAGSSQNGHVQVTLHLSSGPSNTPTTATATVPSEVGQNVTAAKSALTTAGFTNVTATYVQGTGACTVSSMNPTGGAAEPTTTGVVLTVAGAAVQTNGSFQGTCG